MTVPEEFTVTLFAGEPDVHQPIGFCIDNRGRLWVAEAFIYPRRNGFPGPVLPEKDKRLGDRILIFDDTDGDGKFDKKTVFLEGLNLVSGIEVGFGGVWVGAAPYLLFIADKDGDDKPDAAPQILLDGWGYQDTHETLNAFTWGPDGWLYGCHGVFTKSRVGKPGTPDKDRTPLNCCVWRYHPTKHTFEIFSEGTSNPWGLDYNEHGEFFIEACVIPHCFHMIQGGRYLRQAGQHFNPYTYADIGTIADHLHYIGANPHGGNLRSDAAGGGHAHCGLMCYLGGAWPKKYHGQLFMGNIHGKRINMDTLTQKGSGYVASHGADFLLANDDWARFINLKYGPDGNVYLIDWYDKQACHRNEPEIWDRTNGRIYKISYRGTKPVKGLDLQKCTDEELVKYQTHENEWYVRHARRILQERAANDAEKGKQLLKLIEGNLNPTRSAAQQLRFMWAIHAVGQFDPGDATAATTDGGMGAPGNPHPEVRAWAVRLALDAVNHQQHRPFTINVREAAKSDSSPVVRRSIASGIRNVPKEMRPAILAGLLSHAEDASDHNLPFLYWYALEPLAGEDPKAALELAANGKIPMLLQFTARRIATTAGKDQNEVLAAALAKAADQKGDAALLILRGMSEGFRGRKDVPAPATWAAMSDKLAKLDSAEAKSLATSVSITFGDAKAFGAMRAILADAKASTVDRQAALTALVNGRDKELAPVLQKLVAEGALRGPAIRALAGYDDPKTPGVLLEHWKSLKSDEVRDALNTFAARPAYANALLDAVAGKKVQPADITADIVRAMRNLSDKGVTEKIAAVWGAVRDTPEDRKKLMLTWKNKLGVTTTANDLMLGRAIFAKTCQQCHVLYGVGGKVGPDITGSDRKNVDYLLENIFDPHAVIPKDYAQTIFQLGNGRTVTGILKGDNGNAYSVQTPNELLVINKGDVDEMKPSTLSLMPDDQMKPFSDKEVRALFAYLRSPAQVPMLATAENVKDFFNGKDLTGWTGDPKLWSVENGEIVGKTTGLKRNEFLFSSLAAENFKLTLKVKLTPPSGNSGIQFRSEPFGDGQMKGPQADIGAGWWGKLYEEHGRELLAKEGGEKYVKPGEWNDYVVEAYDGDVRITINGNICTDYLKDDKLARRGIFGLQLHSGPAQEVRFKDIKLEVITKK
jgi:putative membrane-bound dehydrogenase-like protein